MQETAWKRTTEQTTTVALLQLTSSHLSHQQRLMPYRTNTCIQRTLLLKRPPQLLLQRRREHILERARLPLQLHQPQPLRLLPQQMPLSKPLITMHASVCRRDAVKPLPHSRSCSIISMETILSWATFTSHPIGFKQWGSMSVQTVSSSQ